MSSVDSESALAMSTRIGAVRDGMLLALLLGLLGFYAESRWNGSVTRGDNPVYTRAIENVRAGNSMYAPLPAPGPHALDAYIYPPPFAAVMSLLPDYSSHRAMRLLLLAQLAGLLATGLGLAWLMGRRGIAPAVLWTCALLPFAYPAIDTGNINTIIWALAVWGLIQPTGGLLLMTAAILKVTPVWPLGVLLVRQRSNWTGALVTAVVTLLLTILAIGLESTVRESVTWFTQVMPTLSQGQFAIGRASFAGRELHWLAVLLNGNLSPTFAPLFWLVDDRVGPLPAWARLWLTVTSFGVPALTLWLTRGRTPREQAAFVLAAATLCAPIVRFMYLPLLLPGILLAVASPQTSRHAAIAPERAGRRVVDLLQQFPFLSRIRL